MFTVSVFLFALCSLDAKQVFHLGLGPHLPSVDLSFNPYNHNPLNNIVSQFLHQNHHHQSNVNNQGFQHWSYHPINVLHPTLHPVSGSGHQQWKPFSPPSTPGTAATQWSPVQEASTDEKPPEQEPWQPYSPTFSSTDSQWSAEQGDSNDQQEWPEQNETDDDDQPPQQVNDGGQVSEDTNDENGCKNDLEALINKERSQHGLGVLQCDDTMRNVAGRHTDNLIENNPATASHSWYGQLACDYNAHPECMWSKPKVR